MKNSPQKQAPVLSAALAGLEDFSFAEPVVDITPQADPVGFTLQEKSPHAYGGGIYNQRNSKNKPLFRGKKVRNKARRR